RTPGKRFWCGWPWKRKAIAPAIVSTGPLTSLAAGSTSRSEHRLAAHREGVAPSQRILTFGRQLAQVVTCRPDLVLARRAQHDHARLFAHGGEGGDRLGDQRGAERVSMRVIIEGDGADAIAEARLNESHLSILSRERQPLMSARMAARSPSTSGGARRFAGSTTPDILNGFPATVSFPITGSSIDTSMLRAATCGSSNTCATVFTGLQGTPATFSTSSQSCVWRLRSVLSRSSSSVWTLECRSALVL